MCGQRKNYLTLIVFATDDSPPQITTHPTNQSVIRGQGVAFSITTKRMCGVSYQWMKDDEDITSTTHRYYQGATTSLLHISEALAEHEGNYKCTVRNDYGGVESHVAQLIVGKLSLTCIHYLHG